MTYPFCWETPEYTDTDIFDTLEEATAAYAKNIADQLCFPGSCEGISAWIYEIEDDCSNIVECWDGYEDTNEDLWDDICRTAGSILLDMGIKKPDEWLKANSIRSQVIERCRSLFKAYLKDEIDDCADYIDDSYIDECVGSIYDELSVEDIVEAIG